MTEAQMELHRVTKGRTAIGPPSVPFVIAVGVTGHRADVLPEGSPAALRTRIRETLTLIAEAGADLLEQERDCFAPERCRLRFVSPALYRNLIERRIGVETMDSGAASRTYTVLANEGRRAVAAILLAPAA